MLQEDIRPDRPGARNGRGSTDFFGQFSDLLLQHGARTFEAAGDLSGEQAAPLDKLVAEGLLARSDGRPRLTPKGLAVLEHRVLMETLRCLGDRRATPTANRTNGGAQIEPGASEREEHLFATLSQALRSATRGCPILSGEADWPVDLSDYRAPLSVAMLLGMGESMAGFERLAQAKRTALALHGLVREQFVGDAVNVIGMGTTAEEVAEERIALLVPRKGMIGAGRPAARFTPGGSRSASAPLAGHTNIQMGLNLAGRLLARRGETSKLAFVVLGGGPNAYQDGRELVLTPSPDAGAAAATLAEAADLARAGVRLVTFALIDDHCDMDWVDFADQLTRRTRGIGYYCGSDDLPGCVVESFLAAKKNRSIRA